ncbi:NDMA-dependent alcohol dehydrogenase [Kineococcus aurantiacus]|uniref:S-(Hydroxymethyl)glutathione dehydrogenase/alcohol dehydrogenase n=1 Tax=Kineococcus aurantiacus TaxID=37633 RepID=A0A7Y9J3D2_9ACTN|nr:NDMA-dependent alcohol dehydrogenase [Kineococcus aurantiacus]NYD25119.1 S-(hydroxymethyl)glutathione dehydrogenase/alcohol dehydrogenase [Kineococcus aurantiacus]
MKTTGAICWEPGKGKGWSVEEIEIDEPRHDEVLVKLAASGLCHSDDHIDAGHYPDDLKPVVGGHEGAGIVLKVGSSVSTLVPGDHVVLTFVPSCGRCESCVSGRSRLCDLGAITFDGVEISDGTQRIHARGQGLGTMCLLGTFSPYVVVHEASAVKIRDDVPLDKAALVGCGVTTGWHSAVTAGQVGAGETVVVVGLGGVGMNSVQGARMAGARRVVAVDLVPWKVELARRFGATHTATSIQEAETVVRDLTWGKMAEKVILTVGVLHGDLLEPAMKLLGKGGSLIETAVADIHQTEVTLDLFSLNVYEKKIIGTLYGSANARTAIPQLLDYYMSGELKLDELVTRTYSLEQINEAYQDMRDGKLIRGVVVYDLDAPDPEGTWTAQDQVPQLASRT